MLRINLFQLRDICTVVFLFLRFDGSLQFETDVRNFFVYVDLLLSYI